MQDKKTRNKINQIKYWHERITNEERDKENIQWAKES